MIKSQIAIVFPGQGSQEVGMLQALTTHHPLARLTFTEASDALGYDVLALATQGPAEQLNQTEYTQPALLTAGVAVYRVLQNLCPFTPAMMAGHSLGEYTALVCAESLNFSDAVKLVAERGRLMQAAVPAGIGAMAAIIGLDLATIQAICEKAATETSTVEFPQKSIVAPANINAIGQVVISGHKSAVEQALVLAKEQGAKIAKLIPVSVPSHSDLMRPAAEKLQHYLQTITINTPNCTLIHNVDVASHQDAATIQQLLVEQLYSPVRWVETIQYFAQHGITNILELGPGKVLAGLNKRIVSDLPTLSVYDESSLDSALTLLKG